MKRNPINFDPNMKNDYIDAPYVLEEGDHINDFYLEPVLFHNENGPTIGVTTCGVIVKDGLYFKDMVAHLPLKQQADLVLNTLWNTPLSMTRESAKDENGNIVPAKVFKQYDPPSRLLKVSCPVWICAQTTVRCWSRS